MPDVLQSFAVLPAAIYGQAKRKTGQTLYANIVILILLVLMERKAGSIKALINLPKIFENIGRRQI